MNKKPNGKAPVELIVRFEDATEYKITIPFERADVDSVKAAVLRYVEMAKALPDVVAIAIKKWL